MERRKFLIGLGGTAIGSSALVGSGAFSSSTMDRQATIHVVEDSNGLLALNAVLESDTISENTDGELEIDASLGKGLGINTNSIYYFGEYDWGCVAEENAAFTIVNNDTVSHDVTIEFLDGPGIWWRACHEGQHLPGGEFQASRSNEYTFEDVGPGEMVTVQFHIDARQLDVGDDLSGTITISAT